jgi:uncharacterized protein (TIGR01777 family)
MKKKILITGGSGLIGKKLTALLQSNGYSVSILSRKSGNFGGLETFSWDPAKGQLEEGALQDLEAIIHLAGADIAKKKWTRERKAEIIDSRVKSAELLLERVKSMKVEHRPGTFISSSGVGYYGYDTGSILVKESSRFGDDFLATVCKAWESAADSFSELSMKVVKLRTGFVLSGEGGALKVMAKPVKLGFGAGLGRGDQYLSWIHIDDLVRMFLLAVENPDMEGVYNAVGPSPTTNKEMMKQIASVLNKPFFLPNVPAFALKMVMGEMASMVTGGNKVSSEKIESLGFTFHYQDLNDTLENLLKG